ncbi:MAG: TonB-dependent receptor [Acidobacteria bacterium]|nr:TonB-dependent receptor [Acidobacteriota bacterium]
MCTFVRFVIPVLILFNMIPSCLAAEKAKEKDHAVASGEKPVVHITEEVEVVAKAPEAAPISAVATVDRAKIEVVAHKDLAQALAYASGTYVSTGTKRESTLQIRGLSSQKIVLLYDGIPIYEPYFGSFDLNTLIAEEVESIKVVKGMTSVLYGPNVLGGAVNVITRRPDADTFRFTSTYGSFDEVQVAATGTARRGPFGFLGSFSYNRVDDFDYTNTNGDHLRRANTDYDTKNFTGKFYYYPGESSELMAEFGYITSEYGLPWAIEHYRERYWRFSDWDRWLFNVGGTFPLGELGYFKARGYYVKHHNVLDAYTSAELDEKEWLSTFNNYSYGVFALGSVLLNPRNELKFSFNAKSDHARTQDDLDEPWEEFSQNTVAVGVEDHFALTRQISLVAGVSVDYLNKEAGNNKTAWNPLGGIRFAPAEDLHVSFSVSQKSRFPTMKDLYSSTAGNPDLREERGTNYELGFGYDHGFRITGAVFTNRVRDLIEGVRMPEGWRVAVNIGRARITGFEVGIARDWAAVQFSANYTYLNTKNLDTGLDLPLVPESQFNVMVNVTHWRHWRFSLWGIAMDESFADNQGERLRVPAYMIANAGVTRRFEYFDLFAKVENLLDADYVTEPGFPMKSRTFRVGLRLHVDRD